MNHALQFLKEVGVELSKVVWPSKEQTVKLTIMVITVTIAVGLFIGGMDFILAQVSSLLFR